MICSRKSGYKAITKTKLNYQINYEFIMHKLLKANEF